METPKGNVPETVKTKTQEEQTSTVTSTWISPPTSTCIIDVEEFVKQAKEYANIVTPTGLIINIPDLKSAENRIISVFVVDKKLKLQKGYIMESPADTGINIQLIVTGKNLPICDILLAIQEECVALIKKIFKIRRVCSE